MSTTMLTTSSTTLEQDCHQFVPLNESTRATDEKLSLATIPDKILLSIAKHLPKSSSAALSLCAKKLLRVLGPECLSFIQEGRQTPHRMPWDDAPIKFPTPQHYERFKFILLLGRDMPHMVFCYFCQRFHEPFKTGSDSDVEENNQRACTYVEGQDNRHMFFDSRFNFSTAQFLMNRCRSGQEVNTELSDLTKSWTQVDEYGETTRISNEFRIAKERLYLRTKLSFCFPRFPCFKHLPSINDFAVCPHISVRNPVVLRDREKAIFDSLEDIIRCATGHTTKTPYYRHAMNFCFRCSSKFECAICATEFIVQCGSEEPRKFRFTLTSWKVLGECRWPFEPTWAHHRTVWASYNLPPTPEFEGSIKDDFEMALGRPGVFKNS